MPERAIGLQEVCRRMKICRQTFYKNLSEYKADGLLEVRIKGSRARTFLESSVDALLQESAATGNYIGELSQRRRGRKIAAGIPN